MPYISSAEVAQKRKEIKDAFPNWKFSITQKHHSGINVSILEADINFGQSDRQVNTYYIHEHFEGPAKDALTKIYSIAAKGKRTLVEDGDYGTVPTFYVWLNIGEWNRPFKLIVNGSNGSPLIAIRQKAK